jgi:uncharacterized protein (DUF1499 family)
MKLIFALTAGLILFMLLYFVYLGIKSHSGSPPGLVNQRLSSCPDTPNCINSEFKDDTTHFIDALPYQNKSTDEVIRIVEGTIQKTGGHLSEINENYIAATYTSKLFRYVDDFEIRVDSEDKNVHFRSASRVGRSDFGANSKRIDLIKSELRIQLH